MYKVIVSGYGSKELQKSKSGWYEELTNLSKQLTSLAEEGWRVEQIVPIATGFGILYTILLHKTKQSAK